MSDLIEKLQHMASPEFANLAPEWKAVAREAAAALEAAREDAERYRHLRSNESSGSADLCICHVRWAKRGGETTEYVLLVEDEADAAIDQARGKGVR